MASERTHCRAAWPGSGVDELLVGRRDRLGLRVSKLVGPVVVVET